MHDAGVPAGVFNLVNGEGAQVGAALAPGRPQGLERGFYVRPTLFSDVEPQMRIAQEQIFGPVLAIIPYPPWSPDAPLGGYKRSDNGREYGIEGLEEYLETKAILGYLDGAATSVPSGRQ
jgi:aldehyde dehydrogenase (NAD+)